MGRRADDLDASARGSNREAKEKPERADTA